MGKLSVKKEILIIMMIIAIILTISSKVFATGTSSDNPVQIPVIDTNTTPSTDTNTEVPSTNTETPNTNVANPITPTTNTTGSTYQNTESLPQTGDASDYAIFLLIVVAIVVAVYAYRKVKEYNI